MSAVAESRVSSLRQLFKSKHDQQAPIKADVKAYDHSLILLAISLLSIGLVVVTSASMPVADRLQGDPFYCASRHGIYIVGAIIAAVISMSLSDFDALRLCSQLKSLEKTRMLPSEAFIE